MRRTSWRLIALVLGPALAAGLTFAAPASATLYGGPDCYQPRAEAHPGGSGNTAPVAHDDDATVSEGRGLSIDVLGNDTDGDSDDLQVIAISTPSAGTACLTSEGEIYYYSLGAVQDGGPDDNTDSFSYAITDGDFYRTATVHVSVIPTATAPPVVTQRLQSSGGRVTRKGEVTVTNPDAEHTIIFYAGPSPDDRDIHRTLQPGATTVVPTSRSSLVYATVALGGLGSFQDYVGLRQGRIDTVTGRVLDSKTPVDTHVPNDDLDLNACHGFAAEAVDSGEHAPAPADDTFTAPQGAPALLDVLANDTDRDGDPLTVVSTDGSDLGFTCASGTAAYYLDFGTLPDRNQRDSFTYTVTDGDRIRTASVELTLPPIAYQLPIVTRRIQTSAGRVVRKAQVRLHDPDDVHAISLLGGAESDGPFDIRRTVYPGGTTVVDTSRSRLYFRTSVTIGDRFENDEVEMLAGVIDTATGRVTLTYRWGDG